MSQPHHPLHHPPHDQPHPAQTNPAGAAATPGTAERRSRWGRWLLLGFVEIAIAATHVSAQPQRGSITSPVTPTPAPVVHQSSRPLSVQAIAEVEGLFQRFTPDGQGIITVTADRTKTYLYDVTGRKLHEFAGAFDDLSPTGQHLVTSNQKRTYLYTLSGKSIAQFPASSLRFNADGQRLVRRDSAAHRIALYDLTGQSVAQMAGDHYHLSADGKFLIIGPQMKEFVEAGDRSRLYDTASGQQLAEFEGAFHRLSADGMHLVTLSAQDKILLYTRSGRKIGQFAGDFGEFSPTEPLLAVSVRGESTLYNFAGQPLAQFAGYSPQFSPDGNRLITHTDFRNTGVAAFLYTRTGKLLAELPGGLLNFRRDGKAVLVFSAVTGKNYLYDASGQRLAEFAEEFSGFSEDGQLLATAAWQTLRGQVRNLSGKMLAPLDGKPVHFAPDSRSIVTTLSKTSRIYRLSR